MSKNERISADKVEMTELTDEELDIVSGGNDDGQVDVDRQRNDNDDVDRERNTIPV